MNTAHGGLRCSEGDAFSQAYATLSDLVALDVGDEPQIESEILLTRARSSGHLDILRQELRAQGHIEGKRRDVVAGVKALNALERMLDDSSGDLESECAMFAQAKIALLWVLAVLDVRPHLARQGIQTETLGQLARISVRAHALSGEIDTEERPLQQIAEGTDELRSLISSFYTNLVQGGQSAVPVWMAQEVVLLDLAIVRFQIDPEEHASALTEAITVLSCACPLTSRTIA